MGGTDRIYQNKNDFRISVCGKNGSGPFSPG